MIENIFKDHDEEFLVFLREIDNDIKNNRILIVLDIDLTLVCAEEVKDKVEIKEEKKEIKLREDEDYNIIYREIRCFSGKKRPHLNTFLDYVFENFDIAVWSAGNEQYVKPSVEHIFGERKSLLKFVYHVEHCENGSNKDQKIKPLSKITGYNPSKIIIIDDNENSFIKNEHNAIKISSWSDDKTDDKLLKCIEILKILKTSDNIPNTISQNKFHEGF